MSIPFSKAYSDRGNNTAGWCIKHLHSYFLFAKLSDFIHLNHKIKAISVLVKKNGSFVGENTYYDIIILFCFIHGLKPLVLRERWAGK